MENKQKKFIQYLDKSMESCVKQEQQLIADSRKDEANMMKVKANIYDIFKSMFQLSVKNKPRDPAGISEAFLKKLDSIPQNWMKSYDLARRNQDAVKILVEETKLDTVKEIRNVFMKIWVEQI